MSFLAIGSRKIGPGEPCYIIAEIGNNHNGDFNRAKTMIDLAIEAGADCVKFQMRKLEKVYRKKSLARSGDDLNTEYVLDLLEKFELSETQHQELAKYAHSRGITYMCTPWDTGSLDILDAMGVPAYKVASADLTNFPLLAAMAAKQKPLIVSTGMSTDEEVQKTIAFLKAQNAQFVLLHCNSTYPAPFHSIHLRYMTRIQKWHPFVGYSGHERGIAVTQAAVALGAQVVERHFTLDRNMEGPDHAASLEPGDFKALTQGIRQVEESLGSDGERQMSQGEMMNRENLAKSLVASRALRKGQTILRSDIDVKSPGRGLSPILMDQLVGRVLKRDMTEEEFFYPSDLVETFVQPRAYKFRRPWGIPVRYFDFAELYDRVHPELVEFHLSYSDMDLNPADFLKGTYDCDFVVHAPELFAGSHLMDLATPDAECRKFSLQQTQRVIDITRDLKKYFPKTARPRIVANIGGFTMDAPLPEAAKAGYYAQFAASLKLLNLEGVELTPQTMAPFPWHFGGQRYQNIFVLPDETVAFCKEHGLRLCLDVSHTKLTCNFHKLDFNETVAKFGEITTHLHFGDAKGLNGEGLQVDEGEIDFPAMQRELDRTAPEASFIPEIWQGHKNGGEGFWIGLERLEKYFGVNSVESETGVLEART